MYGDINSYKEKIENKEIKINELKEELKQLEKNIEANNRIFMRKYQKNSKPTKKNMFLFHSSRTGINNTNKKQDIIIYKKNIKPQERKKAKSTPKIGTYINTNKNNFFFTNSDKKKFNFNIIGSNRGKTLDYKNNKINLNNIKNTNNNNYLNKYLEKNKIGQNISNNIKQIKINSDVSQELNSNNDISKNNKYNKTEPNYIINIINNFDDNYFNNLNDKIKNNIFVNKSITNTSSQNSYNNSKINNRKDNMNRDTPTKIKDNLLIDEEKTSVNKINEDTYKIIENKINSVFIKYFSYYKGNVNKKVDDNSHNKNNKE